ncbi:MAG TPA: competence/damage-inducible protein A [Sandaracinaceae bacterium LLY-WYZ-13_1]|nr:competence/damage-inducible protein A [Sandaracinaceae bacterium LLY-WYZ-13_1]
MTAAVLSIGTELTRGELTNTNASWLAEQLTELGCTVAEQVTVSDDLEAIQEALTRMTTRHRVLVCTGGLGPTTDDLTAQAVAGAAGVDLVRDEPSLEAIRRRYAAAGREMSETNAKQADFPQGAEVLPNPVGTAPGFSITLGECACFFLPGVPHEMQRIFADRVQPTVAPTVERDTYQQRLRTFGLPESTVGERLAGLEEELPGLTIGYRATFPEIEVKLCARAAKIGDATQTVTKAAEEVRRRLGDAVYGRDDDTYPAYVGHLLRDRGLTVALAESCTGGMVSSLITDVPGSSDYLLMSAVTYSNASKSKVLGVSAEILRAYGAVSAESAAAMADGARRLSDADLAVSITGIAGPGGGTEEKPVGTVWLGVARRGREADVEKHQLSGDRWRVRRLSAFLALRALARAATEH